MASATARVLAVAELLEKILLHLDNGELNTAPVENVDIAQAPALRLFPLRRVSKAWDAVIEGSINLQARMFLALGPHPPVAIPDRIAADHMPTLWLLSVITPLEATLHARKEAETIPGLPTFTDVFRYKISSIEGNSLEGYPDMITTPDILHCQIDAHLTRLKGLGYSFFRPEASWRRMRVSLSTPRTDQWALTFKVVLFCTAPRCLLHGQEWQLTKGIRWLVKHQDTLGDIFDGYFSLLVILKEFWDATRDASVGMQAHRDAIQRARGKIMAKYGQSASDWVEI